MHRLIISVLVFIGIVGMTMSYPIYPDTTTQTEDRGPQCTSPLEPYKPVDCAAIIELAALLLKEYETALETYEAEQKELALELAMYEQIGNPNGGGNSQCRKVIVSFNPYTYKCKGCTPRNSC